METLLHLEASRVRLKSKGFLAQHSKNVSVPLLGFTYHFLLEKMSDASTFDAVLPTPLAALPRIKKGSHVSGDQSGVGCSFNSMEPYQIIAQSI
jgi:hypothetical protein